MDVPPDVEVKSRWSPRNDDCSDCVLSESDASYLLESSVFNAENASLNAAAACEPAVMAG